MRTFTTALCVLAVLGPAAVSARAGGLWLDWSYNTSTSPTATTNGVWWIDTGSGPTLMPFDVNVEVLAGTSLSTLGVMYPNTSDTPPMGPPSIWLLSDGTADNDITFNGPGLCCPLDGTAGEMWYQVPGTDHYSGEPADWFDVTAWTGNYTTYDAAYAASAAGQGVYVAQVLFQNPTDSPIDITNMPRLSNSPAVVLQRGLPGDANYDGKVDINDLTIVLAHYNATGATWPQGDFNNDGKVDINDLTIVLANYNKTLGAAGPAGLSAVPEPSAMLLAAAALAGCLAYAARRS